MNSNGYFQVNTDVGTNEKLVGAEQQGWLMDHQTSAQEGAEKKTASASFIESAASSASASAEQEKKEDPFLLQKDVFQRIPLLQCYSVKKGEIFQVPASTSVHCFWCSHAFDGSPHFLPVKEETGTFHVYGNFCTPQCGLAFLLKEHLDPHVRWERMSLLHRMYKPRVGARLYPSPPRESLVSFGGPYTIDAFRKSIYDAKDRVDIQTPPMVSILGTLDTKPIDFYDSSLQNTFTQGFTLDRFRNWSEQGGALRLKRSKPLKDRESTLDACFKINVQRVSSP
jgi:hypothetical protein